MIAIPEFSGYCGLNSKSLFGIGVRNTCKFCLASEEAEERKRGKMKTEKLCGSVIDFVYVFGC